MKAFLLFLITLVVISFINSCGNGGSKGTRNKEPNLIRQESVEKPTPTPQPLSLQEKLAKIHNGMTESEVTNILGEPNDRLDNYVSGFQNLFYRSGNYERVVRLRNGKVFEIMDPNGDW